MATSLSPEDPAFDPCLRFNDGAAYETMMGRWSVRVAAPFLDWLALPPGLDWLDDGCGNGVFSEVLMSLQAPRSVVGVDPSAGQLAFARQRPGAAGVRFIQGDAQALPLPDTCVDAAVMALVLFFVPDPARGLQEMLRVVRPGGTIAAYHWDMAGGGFPLQPVLAAVRAEGHASQEPPSTWASALDASGELWRTAGLVDVQTRQFEVSREFESFDEYWRSAHGSPRLKNLLGSLEPAALKRLTERVRKGVGATHDGPLVLNARANAVKGRSAPQGPRPVGPPSLEPTTRRMTGSHIPPGVARWPSSNRTCASTGTALTRCASTSARSAARSR